MEAEVEQDVEIDLVDVLKSLRLGLGEELFLEDGLEFAGGALGHVAADRVRKICFDALLDGDARPLRCSGQDFPG